MIIPSVTCISFRLRQKTEADISLLIRMRSQRSSEQAGEKIKPSGLVKSAFTSPVFIAVVLGIICGISGIIKSILDTDFGIVYMSVKNSVTAILNSLILILVGFDFEFERKRIKVAFRAIISRVLVQGMLLLPFLFDIFIPTIF